MARRPGRQRNQLPSCYHEGYLEKRSFKDRTSRKLWSCLCGTAIYFFNDMRDSDYIERLDLSQLISVTDDNSQDRNLDAARFTFSGKDGIIKFTAPNAEARELWKGFILSVTQLSVPSSLNLLPGQINMLREAVQKETELRQTFDPPAVTTTDSSVSERTLPLCYHSVSRLEAELLLEKESKRGNLLLRPGSHTNSYAISTRQEGHNGALYRHYRVTRKEDGGFAIALENPVSCATLQDAVNYLVDRTEKVMIPLTLEDQYEKNIFFIQSDNENGERSVQQALPSLPPKPAVRKENVLKEEEEEEEEEKGSAVATLPRTSFQYPVPAPRRFRLASAASTLPPTVGLDQKRRSLVDVNSELNVLFQKMAMKEQ